MRLRWLGLILAIGLAAPPVARADEEYDKLLKEFMDAQQKFYEKLQKQAEESEAKQKEQGEKAEIEAIDMTKGSPVIEFMPRFRKYAEDHAGKPEAIPALAWIVNMAGMASGGEPRAESPAKWALDRLSKDHAAQPGIKEAIPALRYSAYEVGQAPLVALYEKVIAENKDKEAVGWARFNLACALMQPPPEEGQEQKASDAEKKRARELFEKVIKDRPTEDLAANAEGYLFELDHLQLGMIAPDFTGTDANEKEIKLSQFRGQVVVIDFWGFW
jgi:hypothetical protein